MSNFSQTRTYCPGVRVGNWNDDIALEEELLKDFMAKRDKGELLCQKNNELKKIANTEVKLSVSRDGQLHFGDTIMIVNPGNKDRSRQPHALNMCIPMDALIVSLEEIFCTTCMDVSGSPTNMQPVSISTFIIRSCDGSHVGEPLRYDQPFYLCTSDGRLFLHSDKWSFSNCTKKSRHNRVMLMDHVNHMSEWRILPFDPKFRMELQFSPVPANSRIILNHIKTNQDLCLEENYTVRTPFGVDKEISALTCLDSHRAEMDVNHWMFVLYVPGDDICPIQPPEEKLNCENPGNN